MNLEAYISLQRDVNFKHLDGRLEAEHEEALDHATTFSRWLKAKGMPATSFVDLGCRTGYAMDALAGHFPAARVVGVDIVPEFVMCANRRGEAVEGDLQKLPFENEEFDWGFSCTSIEHCPDLEAAIKETRRVCKYGFYLQTDIEDDIERGRNISHFVNRPNPQAWLEDFFHPAWWLVWLNVPRSGRIEMIWLRREYTKFLDRRKA